MAKKVESTKLNPRVQILLSTGEVFEGDRGTTLEELLIGNVETDAPIVGAVVNGELRELTYTVDMESKVTPVTMGDADGMRFYRRSLTFLLAAVFEELFPDNQLYIDHSVSSGGYFCRVNEPLTAEDIELLGNRMRELVERDLPFKREVVPLEEAVEYVRSRGYVDKVRLLAYRKKPTLVFYRLGDLRQYHHGYMVPSTGYLKWFSLVKTDDGLTLCFPRRHWPTALQSAPEFPKLLSTFRQYGDWLTALGISSVGALNDAITDGRSSEVILVSEALHERRIAEIAGVIAGQQDKIRLVLIAGPSASGKTTFSKRLTVQLLARGISPFPIEMDNFFVDRDKTPIDESGEFDFESLGAVDVERLNHDLQGLIAGKTVRFPRYDFKQGLQLEGEEARISRDQIIILEGIHGLNPDLLPKIPASQTYRVYTSALTQLNLDRYNRVSTTDTRLIRRIVRDAAYRDTRLHRQSHAGSRFAVVKKGTSSRFRRMLISTSIQLWRMRVQHWGRLQNRCSGRYRLVRKNISKPNGFLCSSSGFFLSILD